MSRFLLVLLVLSVFITVAPSANAMVVVGINPSDTGVTYVGVSDLIASHFDVMFTLQNSDAGAYDRSNGSLYLGWLREWEGVRLSFGALALIETDRERTPQAKIVHQRQDITLRASATITPRPVRLSVGVSGRGVDYLAGLEVPVSQTINLFAGYVSWPGYHSGTTFGISARW